MIDTTAPPAAARRPTKFMADLSRAMQAAAESSRDETMARFAADAKTVVEEIHAASTEEAASLRRRADDDVAAVREWSKAEIARIREETEARIATRKTALDGEMDAHAQVVEARVEQVAATVADFEAQMADVLRAPPRRAGPDPHRDDGRDRCPIRPTWPTSPRRSRSPQVEPFDPAPARLALDPGRRPPAEPGEAARGGDAAPTSPPPRPRPLAYTGDAEVDGEALPDRRERPVTDGPVDVEAAGRAEAVAEADQRRRERRRQRPGRQRRRGLGPLPPVRGACRATRRPAASES